MVYERLENAEEMLAVAEQLGDQEFAFLAHNCRLSCLLELCDGAGLDAEIAAIADLADRIHQPFYRWHGVCLKVIRAVLDGRFDDAERLALDALRIARLRHSEYAAYVYEHAQLVAIRWAQGRFDEYWPEVAYHGERYLWIPRWRESLAAAESGDRAAAALELARAGHGFAEIPRDGFWLLRLCSLAEACVVVGDRADAERLYELLLPYADRNAIALTQVPFGPIALRLGMLATLLGRWDQVETHFEGALERCELLGARAVRPRVLRAYARALVARSDEGDSERATALVADAERLSQDLGIAAAPPAPAPEREARFAREGEFWTIAYEGQTMRLRDVKGLRYIAFLLVAPGREVHALELVAAVEGAPRADGAGLDPLLDPQAKAEYRGRLEDLRAELEEARAFSDGERAAGIEQELDALVEELARAAGLGGRDRQMASPAERARVNVTKAIRTAIKLTGRDSPALEEHLTASIRTGRFCSYAPPGEAPPGWHT